MAPSAPPSEGGEPERPPVVGPSAPSLEEGESGQVCLGLTNGEPAIKGVSGEPHQAVAEFLSDIGPEVETPENDGAETAACGTSGCHGELPPLPPPAPRRAVEEGAASRPATVPALKDKMSHRPAFQQYRNRSRALGKIRPTQHSLDHLGTDLGAADSQHCSEARAIPAPSMR